MAINSIPGVGPQNSDIAAAISTTAAVSAQITANVPTASAIATAVAAPTAATIASTISTTPAVSAQITAAVPTAAAIATAVAAPSITAITNAITANAAPASVTMAAITSSITTNSASAGVTLAAIGTQVASNAPSPNNWTYIGTVAPSAAASTTFSSISGYKKLKVFGWCSNSGSAGLRIQYNGDTTAGNHYGGNWGVSQYMSSSVYATSSGGLAYISISGPGSSQIYFNWEIENATSTQVYKIGKGEYTSQQTPNYGGLSNGVWKSTAAITSITLSADGNITGNLYLMGQN